MELQEKVKLSRINGRVLTFDADVYMKLRTEHHILGKLIGVPVSHPRNHLINGLPAMLTEYESRLLLEKELVLIEDKVGLNERPQETVKTQYAEHKQNVIEDLQKPYIKTRLELTRANMEKIIKGKMNKLLKSGVPATGESKETFNCFFNMPFLEIDIKPEEILEQETERLRQSLSSSAKTYIQIPTKHPYPLQSIEVKTLSTPSESKFQVFRDLWDKGFFISTGDSFGCDFLTYPGDPFHFHASQIVHVVDPNKSLDIKYLVSCGRLSVSVKKTCVFAYPNDDGSITYQTLTWDNPKLRDLYGLNPENKPEKMDES